jgi:DNA-binding winged helix-turn-helix (wHTH) protein
VKTARKRDFTPFPRGADGFRGGLGLWRFRLDPSSRQLRRGTTAVPLRPKLVAGLQHLVQHPGRLITREELLRVVWPP